ncbi:hypothetical protein [Methanofollis ethanolicus]|uniref:hypothetical protein n=1 Tax=Methanofollis ethanolicus TaxID=488124 RepID=UPI00083530B0|nr:hypothetical protein [Methanofollis ethanolicus]
MRGKRDFLVFIFILVSACVVASAHVPLWGVGNDHPDSALPIDDPTKSWVVYDAVDEGGEARYYRLEMKEGDELRLSLFTPEKSYFVPGVVVMGPGIAPSGDLPDSVEVPPGAGAVVVAGVPPERAEYEPFTPAALYPGATYSSVIAVTGTYYVAVFAPDTGGTFGLAVGYREEFSAAEWVLVPLSAVGIHLWEGQPLILVIAPLALTLLAGIGVLARRGGRCRTLPGQAGLLAFMAALLFIGGGAMTLLQMGIALSKTGYDPSALLTLAFALVPVLLGLLTLHLGLERETAGRARGVAMVGIGVAGLVFWAGLIAGPVLACGAGFLWIVGGEGR